jgi:hypothetical protein
MSNLRTRRNMLRILGASAVGAPLAASLHAQGRCKNGYNTEACPMTKEVATAPIKPPGNRYILKNRRVRWTPFFGQKKTPFLDRAAALKMKESQCLEFARVTHPA